MFTIGDRLLRSLTDDSKSIVTDLRKMSLALSPVTPSDRAFLKRAFERYIAVSRDIDTNMLVRLAVCPAEDDNDDTAFFPTIRKRECDRYPKTCQVFVYGDLEINFTSSSVEELSRTAAANAMTLIRLFAPETLKVFQISYCANPARKKLPSNAGEAVDVSHVNSGFTTRSPESRSIMIWRSEEFLKLLSHEIIHCIGADELHIGDDDLQDLKVMFSLDQRKPLLLEETYTELLALVYHSFFVAKRTQNPFADILDLERTFAIFQTAKLLSHFGLKSFKDVFRNSSLVRFKEKTSAFCYYVLKSAVLFDLTAFLQFIRQNDSFVSGSKNGKGFVQLVRRACLDQAFQAAVDSLLLTNLSDSNLSNITAQTLRMTALEIEL